LARLVRCIRGGGAGRDAVANVSDYDVILIGGGSAKRKMICTALSRRCASFLLVKKASSLYMYYVSTTAGALACYRTKFGPYKQLYRQKKDHERRSLVIRGHL
jgi:hypothetical protein